MEVSCLFSKTSCNLLIYASADIDLTNAKTVLRMARIIDEEGHWIAGNDTLVQTGDMVDRGEC
jgi:hypothetical protein